MLKDGGYCQDCPLHKTGADEVYCLAGFPYRFWALEYTDDFTEMGV